MTDKFDKQGDPITLEQWGKLMNDRDYKIIKQEDVGKYWISTVWIGLNYSWDEKAPPLIFETMVFTNDKDEQECERYSTEQEALKGHRAMVEKYKLLT